MKESIINVLALFGAAILVISIWLAVFTLLAAWKAHVKEKKRRRKRAYEVAHRFEKKPVAKCHCIDCRHCQGFRFADDPFEPKAINCDLWDRGMVTYDSSFCYRADPRK